MTLELNTLQSYDSDFSPHVCRHPSCRSLVWISPDPRLLSAIRAQRLVLDSPPLNGKVNPTQVYDDSLVYRAPFTYPSFEAIRNGQLRYYVSEDLTPPFIDVLFSTPSTAVIRQKYVDPMGSCKPHYERCSTDAPNACLSWINDSQLHREDLMSRQVWRRNQNDYGVNKIYGK